MESYPVDCIIFNSLTKLIWYMAQVIPRIANMFGHRDHEAVGELDKKNLATGIKIVNCGITATEAVH